MLSVLAKIFSYNIFSAYPLATADIHLGVRVLPVENRWTTLIHLTQEPMKIQTLVTEALLQKCRAYAR